MAETAFDGASTGFRLAKRKALRGSPDKIAARELQLLWGRSHDLCRNNPVAVTAKNRLVSHWVGTGIKVRWDNKKIQKLWDEFADNPNIDGWGNLYNLQALWAGAFFESGDVFSRLVIQRDPSQKIPLKVQTLEAEYLDPLFSNADNVRYGIKFDSFGKPLEYNFWQRDPLDFALGLPPNTRIAVPSNDVIHIFNRERPNQWRGLPKLVPVMLLLYEMEELIDATMVRQKVAQAVGWIIKKRESGPLPTIGPVQSTATSVEKHEGGGEKKRKLQKITPGGIHYLQDDEDFIFADTQDIGPNLLVLLKNQWHTISSALDLTYAQQTGDLSDVNFSSIRAGLIELRRRVAMVQQLNMINQGLRPLTNKFKTLAGLYVSPGLANATCKYILPKTDWVDPLKDTQADVLELQAGLATLQEKLIERGVEDFDAHIAQIAREQGLSIVLSSNPAKATKVSKLSKPSTKSTGVQNDPAGSTQQNG
jgi:lambda family phage portal protein